MDILKQLQSKKYNSVFESIKLVPAQLDSALVSEFNLPPSYKNVRNVVLCGMGGSALGAHILQALNMSLVPFCFYNGYILPKHVGQDTLFIASSYSGNTEEVLTSLNLAKKNGAKIIAVAAGGKLIERAKKEKFPFIQFDTSLNPSGQPRYGLGYALGALLNIFIKLGFSDYRLATVREIISDTTELPSAENAYSIAEELKGCVPIVVASEFLEGNAHILVNQFNESCKIFSEFHSIPELNHHLMEGLKRPQANKNYLKFLFIESDLYSTRVLKRFKITKDVVLKNKINHSGYKVPGKTKFEQVLHFLLFGGLLSTALAIIYKEDPEKIPWVNYFKSKL